MKAFRLKALLLIFAICSYMGVLRAQSLGYALSGGGARGFAHIGVLKVLEEEGIRPNNLAGTSIGAIIGALYAIGYNPAEIESICINLDWLSLVREQHSRQELYIGQKRWAPYGNAVFELDDDWVPKLPSSVYLGNKINLDLFRLFATASQTDDFSQFPTSFSCNATNLITGEAKVFSGGSLMQAIRASMSIPSLVRPFEVEGETYIDGGISQNLPIDLLHDQGADKVIAIKVNSSLRKADNLDNLVEVLDQTINIGITSNLNEHLSTADLVLEPDLSEIQATDYLHIAEIIDAGERSARAQIELIRAFKAQLPNQKPRPRSDFNKHLDRFSIAEIDVFGNQHISSAKTKEYLALHTGKIYSTEDIYRSCVNAWNSQAYNTIYPILKKRNDGTYDLQIHVSERQRRQMAVSTAYTSEDKLTAGGVLTLTDCLLKNSKLIGELKLGGRNELNIDYVKNFGEQWGAYYRIFPYINEKTIYDYLEHEKIRSVKSLEWGFTSGVGIFARDLLIGEAFIFSNRNRLYNEIAENHAIPKNTIDSGFGLKVYHESLDDYIFPTKGFRIIHKFLFSRNRDISDFIYSSFFGRWEAYQPLFSNINLQLSTQVGSYFNSDNIDSLNPFALGGSDGFMGYSRNEVSAPHYQIISAGLGYQWRSKWYAQAGSQLLRYSDRELWGVVKNWEHCFYTGIGFNNKLLPARLTLSLNEDKELNSFLSIGYNFDIFSFSRK